MTSVLLLCRERREAQQGSENKKASECGGDSHAAGHPVALL